MNSLKQLLGLVLFMVVFPVEIIAKEIESDSLKFKSESYSYSENPSNLAPVVVELTKNYNNVVEHCGTAGRPAFLCSGVLMRWTSVSEKYHSWDPSPNSIKSGGVSFAYIRKDIKLNYQFRNKSSGVIYYPSMLKPQDKGRAEVLCYFPTDGWVGSSRDKGGCGAHPLFPVSSGECQSQGIVTADAWYKHFISVSTEKGMGYMHQCAFNVGINTPNSANMFYEGIKAQLKIFPNGLATYNNELIVATWPTDTQGRILEPEKLPIQAFFYTNVTGRAGARYYQKDYYNTTGVFVPVVEVVLPKTAAEDVQFLYYGADQHIVECVIN